MVVQKGKYLKEKESSCLHKILHDDILLTDLQVMFR